MPLLLCYFVMTHITFLAGSLLFTTLASAAPAAQDQPWDKSLSQAVCWPGTTLCVDLYNGCGGKTGGCYDACSPTSYAPPPCVPTPFSSTALIITRNTIIIPTPSTSALINTALFAEQIVSPIVDPVSQSQSLRDPAPTPTQPVKPTFTTPEGEYMPSSSSLVDVEPPIKASITAAAILRQNDPVNVACGVKTECWDAVTSLGKDCPRVRYGGCYDVCHGDPKTIFTPKPCKPKS